MGVINYNWSSNIKKYVNFNFSKFQKSQNAENDRCETNDHPEKIFQI